MARGKLIKQRNKDRETIVVLYKLDNDYTPWVTWIARKDKPSATFLGHYFKTEIDAVEDFEKR
jgi:hypothetical protein